MEKLTILKFAEEVLKKAQNPLSVKQILENGLRQGLENPFATKTPSDSLSSALYDNINKKGNDSPFMFASKRPTTFWLKSRINELPSSEKIAKAQEEQDKKAEVEAKTKFNERDLHPLLVKFLNESNDFNLYCKTIFHEQSKKGESGQDKWNFPDIVGVHFPFDDNFNDDETRKFLNATKKLECKLYSFELKILLTLRNLKEYYFQAVSNSSWANEGYLVAFRIDDEKFDDILAELRRLNTMFGIGIIKLEREISESKILIPAKEKPLDTQTLDMLVYKNSVFKKFIANVTGDLNTNDKYRVVKDRYDPILSDEKMEKYLAEKKISDK